MVIKILCILCIIPCSFIGAQQNNKPSSLHQLLQEAEENYPFLKAKKLSVETAKTGVEISTRSSLPSLDAAYQVNYATHNNISGMATAQYFVPISGPPSASNNYSPVFGTVTGLLFNWQPVTFGQRESQIAYSQAGVGYARADAANEILQHKIRLANLYLDVLTITELEKLSTENILRTEANVSVAKTLVVSGIKPGVDTALFSSELSKARIDLYNNQKSKEQAMIGLQQLAAITERVSIIDSSFFYRLPLNTVVADSITHPLLSLYRSSVDLDKAKKNTIAKTSSPSLGVWSTAYGRGSGVQYDGSVKTLDGLGLQRFNYGVGVQLSMPLLQSSKIKPQLKQQDFQIKADEEKWKDINQQLGSQLQTAEITFRYAMQVVKESATLVSSSAYAYDAIVSRYTAGLANYADVIQAQYNLVKAKTDQKTSYMAVWKALLYKAAVTGDLNLFLNQVN
jgi:outer membrane protein TolC